MKPQINTRLAKILVTLLILAAFPLSAHARVKVDADSVDLSAHQTFTWSESELELAPAEKWLRDAIDAELVELGLEPTDGPADLVLSAHATLETSTHVSITRLGPPVRRPFRWHSPTWIAESHELSQGTFELELVDAASGDTMLEAVITGTPRSKEAKTLKKIDKAVAKIFRNVTG